MTRQINDVTLTRVKCIEDHQEPRENTWIISEALVGNIDCPICGGVLEVMESYESSLVEVMTDPSMQSFSPVAQD